MTENDFALFKTQLVIRRPQTDEDRTVFASFVTTLFQCCGAMKIHAK